MIVAAPSIAGKLLFDGYSQERSPGGNLGNLSSQAIDATNDLKRDAHS
jgi:hypothetical protein